MKERLRLLALAAGALALFWILLFPRQLAGPGTPVLPLSTESGPEGYQALWRWLDAQRIPAVSLRRHYDALPALLHAPTGNVLVVTMPQRNPPEGTEFEALRRWVGNGNTLLVLAALEDTPVWTIGADPLFEQHLARLTDLHFAHPTQTGSVDLTSSTLTWFYVKPRGPHPLTASIGRLTALSTFPARRVVLADSTPVTPLQLAVRADTGDTVLWLLRLGAGQIIVSTAASPFANAVVALDGNAQLMANILAWSLAPGGAVAFDDAHHGLTDYYDARAFFADPRLHHTLLWLVGLWLVLVLGTQPLRAVQPHWQPVDETAYVDASARYFAAVVPPPEAARRLIEGFLDRLSAHGGIDSGFAILTANAGVPGRDIAALRDFLAHARAGRRIRLARVQDLLSRLQRKFE